MSGQMDSVTEWLELWKSGDPGALEQVTALVYQDLRRLAAYHLNAEYDAEMRQATTLVHEVYLRMASLQSVDWKGRAHFISVVTKIMRQILVDRARARNAAKRDGSRHQDVVLAQESLQLDTLLVDQALDQMSRHHRRCAQVVEFRFFGDLEFREIAELMDLSLATVERDWRFARAWLRKFMMSPANERG